MGAKAAEVIAIHNLMGMGKAVRKEHDTEILAGSLNSSF